MKNSEKGFNLLEVLLVTVIMGIATAVAVPSLVGQRRQAEFKEDFTEINGFITNSLANANRNSQDVTFTFPSGNNPDITAILNNGDSAFIGEGLNLQPSTKINTAETITYNFDGRRTAPNADVTLIIDSDNTPNSYCITFGLLNHVKGLVDDNGNCINPENLRYDNYN